MIQRGKICSTVSTVAPAYNFKSKVKSWWDPAHALRIVVKLDLTAEDLETFEEAITIVVTKEGHDGVLTHNVEMLYSTVNPMNDEAVLTDAYFAVCIIKEESKMRKEYTKPTLNIENFEVNTDINLLSGGNTTHGEVVDGGSIWADE